MKQHPKISDTPLHPPNWGPPDSCKTAPAYVPPTWKAVTDGVAPGQSRAFPPRPLWRLDWRMSVRVVGMFTVHIIHFLGSEIWGWHVAPGERARKRLHACMQGIDKWQRKLRWSCCMMVGRKIAYRDSESTGRRIQGEISLHARPHTPHHTTAQHGTDLRKPHAS